MTFSGFAIGTDETGEIHQIHNGSASLVKSMPTGDGVRALAANPETRNLAWAGNDSNGLYYGIVDSWNVQPGDADNIAGIANDVAIDASDNMAVGSGNGVARHDSTGTQTWTDTTTITDTVTQLALDPTGSLWVGENTTDNVYEFDWADGTHLSTISRTDGDIEGFIPTPENPDEGYLMNDGLDQIDFYTVSTDTVQWSVSDFSGISTVSMSSGYFYVTDDSGNLYQYSRGVSSPALNWSKTLNIGLTHRSVAPYEGGVMVPVDATDPDVRHFDESGTEVATYQVGGGNGAFCAATAAGLYHRFGTATLTGSGQAVRVDARTAIGGSDGASMEHGTFENLQSQSNVTVSSDDESVSLSTGQTSGSFTTQEKSQ